VKRPVAMITGTGHAAPERVLRNDEFPALGIDTSDAWIRARTGIRERHIAGKGETLTSIAVEAAHQAMSAAHITAPEIDAIIFGGRTRDREPLIRAITDLAEGVYDGLTLGAEATFAAEGKDGLLRYDPMSMRPFMSYPEGRYVQRWLNLIGRAKRPPVFAHVNWFQRDAGGRYLWPGYGENLRPLLWLLDFADGRVEGRQTPVGVLPRKEELRLDGLSIDAANLDHLLSVDLVRWSREVESREEHLSQFAGLPEPIWQAHRRLAQALMGGLGGRTTRSSGT